MFIVLFFLHLYIFKIFCNKIFLKLRRTLNKIEDQVANILSSSEARLLDGSNPSLNTLKHHLYRSVSSVG